MQQAITKLEAALTENEFVSVPNMNVAQIRYIYGSLNLFYLNQIVQKEVEQAAAFDPEELMMASAFGDMAVELIQINHTLGLPSLSEYQVKETYFFINDMFELFNRADKAIYQLSSQINHTKTTHEPLDQALLTDMFDLLASLAHYCGFSFKTSLQMAVDEFIEFLL